MDFTNSSELRLGHANPLLMRSGVAFAVIALSALVGLRLSLNNATIIGVAAVAVAGTVALVRWPGLGLVGLIAVCMLVPFSVETGTETKINAGIIFFAFIVGLWLLDLLWRKNARLHFSRPLVPLFILATTAALSFAVGIRPEEPFAQTAPILTQLGGLAIFWLSALAFLVAAPKLGGTRWLQATTWLFVGLGAIFVVGRVFPPAGQVTAFFQDGATYSLFYVWFVAFTFGHAVINRSLPRLIRLALLGLTFAALYLGFFLQRDWNSGWVPSFVVIAAILCVGIPRIGLPVVLASLGFGVLGYTTISGLLLNSYKQYDILTRQAAWEALLPVMQINPILGLGPANYYWYSQLYPILGYNVHFNSHNNYVDLILQTGVVGLCCFFWFAAELGALAWRLRSRVAPGFERAYICAVLGAIVGTLVAGALGDWFLPFVYNIGFAGLQSSLLGWVFMGSILTFERYSRGKPSATSNAGASASMMARV